MDARSSATDTAASLRDAEQCEAFETGGVNDGFEIADERLYGIFFNIAVRQAVAARVVADQSVWSRDNSRYR